MDPGYIDLTSFLTQTGDLQVVTYDNYAQPVVGASTSVACVVYQVGNGETRGVPAATGRETHIGILYTTAAPAVGYILANVEDTDGNEVLDAGRITRILNYNHPSAGSRAILCFLETPIG